MWLVQVSNGGHPEFKTRVDAIRFAVGAARKVKHRGDEALITVEGVDGQRRAFDHDAKGIA
ncbi:hypothetical protein B0E48_17295 [Rhodanobacter sp. C03]|nr:hypothetical protein B0E48_17295 [Rhodanobacter sp. C03]